MIKAPLVAAVTGLLALGLVNVAILDKERLLRDGKVVLLELAPVDPRSLMQGDYMALRFAVARDLATHLKAMPAGTEGERLHQGLRTHDGAFVVVLDEQGVGRFARLAGAQAVAENERVVKYRVRQGTVKLATNAFFFQEGRADDYVPARYGAFRVADNGEALLTGLRDKALKPLGQ